MTMRFHLLILNILFGIGQSIGQGLYEKNTTPKGVEIFFVRSLAMECQFRQLCLRLENKSTFYYYRTNSIKYAKLKNKRHATRSKSRAGILR